MEEKKKHKVMIGIEVILLGMIIAIVGTNAASSNPPSNGVSYSKNSQTTVEGALNDLYTKANYGNASAGQILSGKTALVGGSKVTGTMPNLTSNSSIEHAIGNGTKVILGDTGFVSTNTDGVTRFEIRYEGQSGYLTGGTLFALEQSKVADTIGLTAGKLLKGQSVLGITGTGETSCPTLASQTSSATAGAGDILSGKTAYVNGNKITGSMTNKGAVSETISPGGTYTIPAGYHNGSGKVTASTCPTCSAGINDNNATRTTGKMTDGIATSVGDYYMISYNIGTLNMDTVTFTGCDIIVQDKASDTISGTKYNTTTLICKATGNKIVVDKRPSNWTWYKLN